MLNRIWVRSGFVVAVMGLTVSPALLTSARAEEGKPATPPAGADDLHHGMEAMGKTFKALKGQINDPTKNQSSLALVEELEKQTLAAKGMTPRGASTRPTDERAKYLADYRIDMANLLRGEIELEEALIDGKQDKVAEAFQSLVDQMTEGHKAFRPKRKRD